MITVWNEGGYYQGGAAIPAQEGIQAGYRPETGRTKTMAYGIMAAHNISAAICSSLKMKFDAMASHDITYVGIIQTARASRAEGISAALCADQLPQLPVRRGRHHQRGRPCVRPVRRQEVRRRVCPGPSGGHPLLHAGAVCRLRKDDHRFRLPHPLRRLRHHGHRRGRPRTGQAAAWQRPMTSTYPKVVAVYLTGKPRPGVGPQDVALSTRSERRSPAGTVKNAVMEFFGPGIANLAMDYRSGIDVMTTETACLTSVWETDETCEGIPDHPWPRGGIPGPCIPRTAHTMTRILMVDLSTVEPYDRPALPSLQRLSPSRSFNEPMWQTCSIRWKCDTGAAAGAETKPDSLLRKDSRTAKFYADQGVIAGCSGGTYQNLQKAAADSGTASPWAADAFWLSCLPRLHARDDGADAKPVTIAKLMASRRVHPLLHSAAPASAQATCPPTAPSPSATPPATSPTGKAASPATARCPMWP